MRPTDTTNLRNRMAASRAATGYNDRQFVDVPTHDLEALLAELDELRGRKNSFDQIQEQGRKAQEPPAVVVPLVQQQSDLPAALQKLYNLCHNMNTSMAQIAGAAAECRMQALDLERTRQLPEGHFPLSQERMMGFLNRAYATLQMGPQSIEMNTAGVESHLACILVNMQIRYEAIERTGLTRKKEHEELLGKLDSVKNQRDKAEAERDAIKSESLMFQKHCASVVAERDSLRQERDNAVANWRKVEQRLANHPDEFDTLEAFIDSLKDDVIKAYASLEACMAERDSLKKENLDLRSRNHEIAAKKHHAFKTFVHKFLDDAGVPTDPEPEHTREHGCRIRGRLSWLVAHMVDAKRWRAFRASARIRALGSAGLRDTPGPQDDTPGYAHLGLEVWTMYPGDHTKENTLGRDWLNKYADIAVAIGLGR